MELKTTSIFIYLCILVFRVDSINEAMTDGLNGTSTQEGQIRESDLPSRNKTMIVKLKREKMNVTIPLMKHFLNHSISTIKTKNRLKLKQLEESILKSVRNPQNSWLIQNKRGIRILEDSSTNDPIGKETAFDSKSTDKSETLDETTEFVEKSEVNGFVEKIYEEVTTSGRLEKEKRKLMLSIEEALRTSLESTTSSENLVANTPLEKGKWKLDSLFETRQPLGKTLNLTDNYAELLHRNSSGNMEKQVGEYLIEIREEATSTRVPLEKENEATRSSEQLQESGMKLKTDPNVEKNENLFEIREEEFRPFEKISNSSGTSSFMDSSRLSPGKDVHQKPMENIPLYTNPAFRSETSSSPPFMSQSGKRLLGPQFYPNSFSVPYVYLHHVINPSPENPQLRIAFNIPVVQIRPSALKPMC